MHCIRLSQEGLVHVCDRTNNRLQIFRKDGSFVSEHVYEKPTRGNGTVYDLVFSPDKDQNFIYMIDGMNGEVRIVDRASKETLARFGRPGRQAGQFTALHNIAADRQGNIYHSEVHTGQREYRRERVTEKFRSGRSDENSKLQSARKIASMLAPPDSTATAIANAAVKRSSGAAIDERGDDDRRKRQNRNEVAPLHAPNGVGIERGERQIANGVDRRGIGQRGDGGHDRDPSASRGCKRQSCEKRAEKKRGHGRVDPGLQHGVEQSEHADQLVATTRRSLSRQALRMTAAGKCSGSPSR